MLGGIGLSWHSFYAESWNSKGSMFGHVLAGTRLPPLTDCYGLHAYAQHSGNGFLTSKWFSPPAGASTIVAHIEPLMRLSAPAALNAALDVVHP
jgi:hypothetical protein